MLRTPCNNINAVIFLYSRIFSYYTRVVLGVYCVFRYKIRKIPPAAAAAACCYMSAFYFSPPSSHHRSRDPTRQNRFSFFTLTLTRFCVHAQTVKRAKFRLPRVRHTQDLINYAPRRVQDAYEISPLIGYTIFIRLRIDKLLPTMQNVLQILRYDAQPRQDIRILITYSTVNPQNRSLEFN